jgi:hypothetical protein
MQLGFEQPDFDSRPCSWPAGGRVPSCHRLAPWQPVIPVNVVPSQTGGDTVFAFG